MCEYITANYKLQQNFLTCNCIHFAHLIATAHCMHAHVKRACFLFFTLNSYSFAVLWFVHVLLLWHENFPQGIKVSIHLHLHIHLCRFVTERKKATKQVTGKVSVCVQCILTVNSSSLHMPHKKAYCHIISHENVLNCSCRYTYLRFGSLLGGLDRIIMIIVRVRL